MISPAPRLLLLALLTLSCVTRGSRAVPSVRGERESDQRSSKARSASRPLERRCSKALEAVDAQLLLGDKKSIMIAFDALAAVQRSFIKLQGSGAPTTRSCAAAARLRLLEVARVWWAEGKRDH
jgi:hypothetical protein